MAANRVYELGLIPPEIKFKWLFYDDRCEPSYSTIISMDAYAKDCVHLLLGPICEYAIGKMSQSISKLVVLLHL